MGKIILVTGISGNVGQGIARILAAMKRDFRIIGTSVDPISAGNHLCDRVFSVPYAWENGYAEIMDQLCRDEKVDLIIPSTDFETVYLSAAKESGVSLPLVASSDRATCEIFLDKLLTAQKFESHGIPFAETVLPSAYDGKLAPVIVKPRKGRGSRGIVVNPLNPREFPDENVVQRLYVGREITTAFYVNRRGALHATFTMERALHAGTTVSCSVLTEHESELKQIALKMTQAFAIRGCCNFQSILTEDGSIFPFEVNCRISGTASIRHNLGFPDCATWVEELLFEKDPEPFVIRKGSAVRILMDVVYPDLALSEIQNRSDKYILF